MAGGGSGSRRLQLYNKHGYNLAIFLGEAMFGRQSLSLFCVDGSVRGVREAFHPAAVLELEVVRAGEVRIRGVEAGTFLAMDRSGAVHTTKAVQPPTLN